MNLIFAGVFFYFDGMDIPSIAKKQKIEIYRLLAWLYFVFDDLENLYYVVYGQAAPSDYYDKLIINKKWNELCDFINLKLHKPKK